MIKFKFFAGVFLCLVIGVLIPYAVNYYNNHISEDDYFKNNRKVMTRKIILEIIFSIFAYGIINEFKLPESVNIMGTILIGTNGITIIQKFINERPYGEDSVEK